MTIPAQLTEISYALNGSNLGPFSTVWAYEQDSDVVVQVDLGAGLQTLASSVGYSLTDSGSGTTTGGGTVTLSNALLVNGAWPQNSILYLTRSVAAGQPSAFGEAGSFSPAANEGAIDHTARQIQELKSLTQRTVAGRPGETLRPLPSAAKRALGIFAFDQNGDPVVLAGNTSQAAPPGITLIIPNITYSPDTSTSSPTFVLAPIGTIGEGMFIEIYDVMNNAANYPINIQANLGESINDHGVIAGSHTINNSNTITRYTKRNGQWRVMQYGG